MKYKAQSFSFALIVFLFLPLLSIQSLKAQAPTFEQETRWSVWGGYSATSIRFLGKTEQSQTQIFAFGFQKAIKSYSPDKPNKLLWYTADIIPYIHFDYPKRDENNRRVSRSGFGISPIGFSLTNSFSNWYAPYIQSTGGIIYMEDNFPTDQARTLNFTFDITIANSFTINRFAIVSVGYKFHHISNAETGIENPGLDSNFLFLTFSIQ